MTVTEIPLGSRAVILSYFVIPMLVSAHHFHSSTSFHATRGCGGLKKIWDCRSRRKEAHSDLPVVVAAAPNPKGILSSNLSNRVINSPVAIDAAERLSILKIWASNPLGLPYGLPNNPIPPPLTFAWNGATCASVKSLFNTLCLGLALAYLFGASPQSRAEDWPHWRGPDRNGVSKEKGWTTQWPK